MEGSASPPESGGAGPHPYRRGAAGILGCVPRLRWEEVQEPWTGRGLVRPQHMARLKITIASCIGSCLRCVPPRTKGVTGDNIHKVKKDTRQRPLISRADFCSLNARVDPDAIAEPTPAVLARHRAAA